MIKKSFSEQTNEIDEKSTKSLRTIEIIKTNEIGRSRTMNEGNEKVEQAHQ